MAIRRLIPHLFTAGNLVGGILAIVLTLNGNIELAPFCILISALLDFLDGFVARLLKVPSELGKQLDSLADMVTFGVAPGIMIYTMLDPLYYDRTIIKYINNSSDFLNINWQVDNFNFGTEIVDISTSHLLTIQPIQFFALIIPIFAMFRLAKFNLDTRQTSGFIGLPTPAMTIFIAAIPIITSNITSQSELAIAALLIHPYFLVAISIILSILMVAPIPLFALKFKKFGWKGNEIRYIFLTLSAVMLATLFWWALPLIILLYLVLSIINNVITKSDKNEIQS
ncbi:CDP-alcohol phosphatidyltransferase family protein [Paracrocinitomix mangrovi]|uniref:CDP-alcohol phosphatidyltransferase family protein n=1 Tax=Paracrocinitomix mangrovi TaxID=2862509 RepID=UPI001C8E414C|nr:CDP-alcohol phosphatidyltransferase family protein [Paracrocinitomix mangrovi]UKN01534.1 CDP-alcohol phosphatidyltransferase family protein [Paracrocinitomix mangrovi]